MSEVEAESEGTADGKHRGKKTLLKLFLQLLHLALAAAIFLIGIAEFSVEPNVFDIFGKKISAIPKEVFKQVSNTSVVDSWSLGHILDAPILVLFLGYFLSVLWLKCYGAFAWLLTASQIVTMLFYLGINAGLSRHVLDWRYFSTRAVIIILDVLIISFSWTVLVVTLLHIRGWFPFKVKKYRDTPYPLRSTGQKLVVITWNFIALYMVLGLCLLIWFSKLYVSWACVRHTSEILLLCQFTNMVQCWPCSSATSGCDISNITQCIEEFNIHESPEGPIRCISPLYTVHPFPSAFCVFNYNIGAFTFVTVFSYVGGIYFFMRTVLNALVKCLFSICFVAVHFVVKVVKSQPAVRDTERISLNDEHRDAGYEELRTPPGTSDPQVSLLGPLPHYFAGTASNSKPKKYT